MCKNKERERLSGLDLPILEQETPHTLLELSPKEIAEAQINHLLRSIKQDEGEILKEKYLQDYSLKEIGQKRELRASAVKMRLARARKRAKRSLLVWNEYYEV